MNTRVLLLAFMVLFGCLSAEEDRFALVTGASRGIGKALVQELLMQDTTMKVFAVARGQSGLQELEEAYPSRVIPIVADIGCSEDLDKIRDIVRATIPQTSGLSLLVHNAAVIAPLGDVEYLREQPMDIVLSEMQTCYRTNVIAPHLLTLALLEELQKAFEARVLFISSRAGDIAVPGAVTYSCTKAAVDHLALNLRSLSQGKIAVATMAPGEVDTDMQGDLRAPGEDQLAITRYFRKAKSNNELISAEVAARFIAHLLYETPFEEFSQKKWNVYSTRPENFPEELSSAIGEPPFYVKE